MCSNTAYHTMSAEVDQKSSSEKVESWIKSSNQPTYLTYCCFRRAPQQRGQTIPKAYKSTGIRNAKQPPLLATCASFKYHHHDHHHHQPSAVVVVAFRWDQTSLNVQQPASLRSVQPLGQKWTLSPPPVPPPPPSLLHPSTDVACIGLQGAPQYTLQHHTIHAVRVPLKDCSSKCCFNIGYYQVIMNNCKK